MVLRWLRQRGVVAIPKVLTAHWLMLIVGAIPLRDIAAFIRIVSIQDSASTELAPTAAAPAAPAPCVLLPLVFDPSLGAIRQF